MVHDQSQDLGVLPPDGKAAPRQAVAGLMPPQLGEAMIREVWPTLLDVQPAIAGLAASLIRTIFLAPLGWLLLGPLFAKKFMPGLCKRYTLTNRRLMIQRGLKPSPIQEVALKDIDDVRLVPGTANTFYRSGDLEVVSAGHGIMKLTGVPDVEPFRHAVINAVKAWGGPDKIKGPFLPASAPVKT
jgi:hypothetical protein